MRIEFSSTIINKQMKGSHGQGMDHSMRTMLNILPWRVGSILIIATSSSSPVIDTYRRACFGIGFWGPNLIYLFWTVLRLVFENLNGESHGYRSIKVTLLIRGAFVWSLEDHVAEDKDVCQRFNVVLYYFSFFQKWNRIL